MNILIYTKELKFVGLANRLRQGGHTVNLYSPSRREDKENGFVGNWLKALHECQYVLAEQGDLPGGVYRAARTYNKPIVGASQVTDTLNASYVREYELAKALSLPYPKTVAFNDLSHLYSNIRHWEPEYSFIKYDRKLFPCENQDWMAWSVTKLPDCPMLLQEEVDGLRIDVEGWFNGLDWVSPFLIKTPTAISGSRLIIAEKEKTTIAEKVLPKLTPFLKSLSYRGPFTAKLILTNAKIYVIELYAGFDPTATYAMLEGIKDDIGNFFYEIAMGIRKNLDITFQYCLSSNAYKSENLSVPISGAPVVGIEPGNLRHIFLNSIVKTEENYVVSDISPIVYTATSRGRDVVEAVRRVKRPMERVQFPMMHKDSLPIAQFKQTIARMRRING